MLSKTLWLQLSFTITPAWVTACVGAVQLSCRNFRYGLWPASIAVRPRSLAKFSRAPLGRGGRQGERPFVCGGGGGRASARAGAQRRSAPPWRGGAAQRCELVLSDRRAHPVWRDRSLYYSSSGLGAGRPLRALRAPPPTPILPPFPLAVAPWNRVA